MLVRTALMLGMRWGWVGCLAAGMTARAQGPPPAPVRVATVVSEDVAEHRMITGELRSLRLAEIASQEPGVVLELLVDVGDRVERGHVLARLDDERIQIEKQRTAAERAATSSSIAEEEALRDRWQSEIESLRAAELKGASNARELRDAEVALRQASARVERAIRDVEVYDSRLALLERRLKDMQVVAPFAGTVTSKLTEQGEWLSEGDSVCEIIETDMLEAVLDVPQRYLPSLAASDLSGANIVVKLDSADTRVPVTQVRLVPQIDERSRTFRLVALVDNSAGDLASGLSVVGWVPTGTHGEHLIVPTDAILRNDMGAYLYAARQMGEGPPKAVMTGVNVLFELPGRVVVEAGTLAAGDSVIVEGHQRLFPMAPVMPGAGLDPGRQRDANADAQPPQAGEG